MSHEEEVKKLQNEVGALSAQLSHVTCEKVALDNSYGDQLRLTHQIRTQLAYAQAETAALQQRAKAWEAEKAKLLHEIEIAKKDLEEIAA
jgi:predicted  nucleic acid-binding Zn-ribbon protein